MSHIAMVSIPFHGHVNPSLEVVRELAARGHRVTYANAPSFADVVEATGAQLRPYRSTLPTTWTDDPVDALTAFLDDAIAMLPQLIAAYDDDRPDLFLYDIAGAPARLLGERWGVPAVQLSPTSVAWDGYEQDTAAATEALRADERGAAYFRRFTEWLTEQKSSVTDSVAFMGRPARCLALIPRAMQPQADRVDPAVYSFVGPALGARATAGWRRPAGARRVLLVSLGSAFTDHPEFYRRCVAAFGELPGWHTVLQHGRHVPRAALGELPPSVEAHPWVAQPAVLDQADAFLTHAGMGGSAEGLWAGTPMLVAPQAADQFANADRLVELGVARRVDTATSTADDLRAALLALVDDPAVTARAAALRSEVRAAAGAATAADLIEAELPG
ncbi:macrolide-inactivating glycosyltransferase [Spirilliplanes yamanashiensis]|uniref:Macrolide-inactivating glycosyltransferase n=2 Tax=Spirilliplanes yamanashiensis TaxID=42233 RepID=A0A8J4DH95_9ACTN|nr:macrolide family glycosyltransferase [Spirilliplanes yamanashiensis]MDP9819244.1 MGT family glycosyltransferase [Spirilliplanes yamanashiensis]GIJ01932.1 macrolide-inactivating glycosyltransferase [Spirilliplanes yamanashiensis]